MGGLDGVKRQRNQGKLTVRERIDLLLDKNSFQEIGSVTGKVNYTEENEIDSFVAANCVGGFGKNRKKTCCSCSR